MMPKFFHLGESAVFMQARPVLLTSFVNKVCSLGMSLVPVVIVSRHLTEGEGSLVMTCIRVASVLGTVAGGWMADRIGSRRATLLSFICIVAGLSMLPWQLGIGGLIVFGMIGQYGESVSKISIRLLMTSSVERSSQKEALSWIRLSNNLAQTLSFGVGAIAAGIGVTALMLMDASMAFVAFLVGWAILPRHRSRAIAQEPSTTGTRSVRSAMPFVACAIFLCGWSFLYDIFLSGIAGRLELFHRGEGLRWFSISMVINTIVCSLLAVPATSMFHRPSRVFSAGIVATLAGLGIAVYGIRQPAMVFAGVFVITLAEVALGTLTQFTLVRLTPSSSREGTWYGAAMLVAQAGRLLGAALCFPWVVTHSIPDYAPFAVAAVAAFTVAIPLYFRKEFDAATA